MTLSVCFAGAAKCFVSIADMPGVVSGTVSNPIVSGTNVAAVVAVFVDIAGMSVAADIAGTAGVAIAAGAAVGACVLPTVSNK